MTGRDIRICIFGDSFTVGTGDPAHKGWVGRLARDLHHDGFVLTVYNLGVRGHTSSDVRARFDAELAARLRRDVDTRVVVAVGVNDTVLDGGLPRVAPEASIANLAALCEATEHLGLALLVVGPTPVADTLHNRRIADLSDRFGELCRRRDVPYVEAFATLQRSQVWMGEVDAIDGAHPRSAGYQLLADLIAHPWRSWLLGSGRPSWPVARPTQSPRL
jgi:acyl-CoA thioesterase-1